MAAPVKKRELQGEVSSSDEEDAYEPDKELGMEIKVDFEGRNPEDPDYHGIKTLLQQLFLKAHIDLQSLTDLIISQNYVGSVVKQSQDDEGSDDEDEDVNGVFGITTVINLSEKQDVPCIQQLRDLLKQLASEHATDSTNAMIKNVLENDTAALGLLINERFVNIPAQISVPLLQNLISEMKRAITKKMPFNFSYYILICKLYKANKETETKIKGNKRKHASEEPSIMWSNPEEEIFAEVANCSFEFSVEKDSDNGLSGNWEEDDFTMVPYRRVLLFEADKLEEIIDKIKTQVS